VRTSKSNSAAEAFREGRLVDAERLFRRMVRAAPDDADALHWLGIVLHRLGWSGRCVSSRGIPRRKTIWPRF
jgi:Flp pilus assembly protein TadD